MMMITDEKERRLLTAMKTRKKRKRETDNSNGAMMAHLIEPEDYQEDAAASSFCNSNEAVVMSHLIQPDTEKRKKCEQLVRASTAVLQIWLQNPSRATRLLRVYAAQHRWKELFWMLALALETSRVEQMEHMMTAVLKLVKDQFLQDMATMRTSQVLSSMKMLHPTAKKLSSLVEQLPRDGSRLEKKLNFVHRFANMLSHASHADARQYYRDQLAKLSAFNCVDGNTSPLTLPKETIRPNKRPRMA